MVQLDLKNVHKVTSRGKTYYYAWRGGGPRLKSEPGTPEFVAELAAALEKRKGVDKARISGLCAMYRASDDWKDLSPKTRLDWSRWLDRIQEKFGPLPVAHFDRAESRIDIKRWRDGYKKHKRAADMGLQVMSRLMSFAIAEGKIGLNPVTGIPRLYSANRADKIWEEADFEKLTPHASEAVMRAARLASLTGLRKADLLKLRWSHIKELSIEIPTEKSRQGGQGEGLKTTLIPIYDELRQLLDTIPKTAVTVLTTTAGIPWKSGFGASWNTAVKAAGITLHLHDLRGTAATKFYAWGLSFREIAEIMTWEEDRVEILINTYVRKNELLRDRIRRMNEARTGTAPVN